MARTYGEITQISFEEVFSQTLDRSRAVFVDIGSGKGVITAAAVARGGFKGALGIEKYRDKYEDSMQLRASMPEDVQSKLEFTMSDIADLNLRDLIGELAQPEVLLFCNNLAFGQGMNNRCALSALFYSSINARRFACMARFQQAHIYELAPPTGGLGA